MKWITIIGCSLSIVSLIICVYVFTAVKGKKMQWLWFFEILCTFLFSIFQGLKSERTTIHRNLCICLLLAQIFILPDAPKFTVGCGFIAGFLHYFLLATFAWMLVEGIHVYLMLVKVFETGILKNIKT